MLRLFFLGLFILLLGLYSCVDKDLTNIGESVYVDPEYSIPIGNETIYMENLVDDYAGDLIEIPDTLHIYDSLSIFNYDSILYINPLVLEFEGERTFDFSSLADRTEYITSAMIRTNCINNIPARFEFQVYLYDSGRLLIDSVYNNGPLIVEQAETDSLGQVTKRHELWKHDTYLSQEIIDRLPDVYYVYSTLTVEIENFSATQIKYLNDQWFWSQLGLRIKLDLPLHEL
jgi:hypothetical protein